MRFLVTVLVIMVSSSFSLAQGDFARQIMSAGRYEVKKASIKQVPTKVRHPASEGEKSGDVVVEMKATVETPRSEPIPAQPSVGSAPVVSKQAVDPDAERADEAVEPPLGEQARALFGSDYGKIREFYQEQIHPDDPRLNRVEIQLLPGLAYNDSKSNYSYRSYQMNYGEMDVRSNVWPTPLLGLTGGLKVSLGASLRGDTATGSMLPVRMEAMEIGLKFRRFSDLSRKATSTEFDVLYGESTMNLPVDSTARSRLKSSGLGLGLLMRMPSSTQHAWIVGGRFFPRLQHVETKSATDLGSGDPAENFRLGLDIGGELSMNRESQLIYKMGWSMEKNLFNGPAAAMDVESGVTPSNVTVTNTLLHFSFGYRWGH